MEHTLGKISLRKGFSSQNRSIPFPISSLRLIVQPLHLFSVGNARLTRFFPSVASKMTHRNLLCTWNNASSLIASIQGNASPYGKKEPEENILQKLSE